MVSLRDLLRRAFCHFRDILVNCRPYLVTRRHQTDPGVSNTTQGLQKNWRSRVWWHMPVTSALGKMRQEHFQGSLDSTTRVHTITPDWRKLETQGLGNMYFWIWSWSRKKKGALPTQPKNVHRVSGLDGGDTRQFIPWPGGVYGRYEDYIVLAVQRVNNTLTRSENPGSSLHITKYIITRRYSFIYDVVTV